MNSPAYLFHLYIIIVLAVFYTSAKIKGKKVPCPEEDSMVCIECKCDNSTGFNTCRPKSACPKPITSMTIVTEKDKHSKCPYGVKVTAQCILCECSGEGGDHCAMCYALPVRRKGQPADLNKKLPQVTDNRIFNYEINGWKPRSDDD